MPENFGVERLASLNERLLSYGPPDWSGSIEPADHGPALGEPLGCTRCHNGELRGVLTVSTSEGMLWQKMVDQLSMRSSLGGEEVPDQAAMALRERERAGQELTMEQSAELEQARNRHQTDYERLYADRLPTWQRWVLEEPCDMEGK